MKPKRSLASMALELAAVLLVTALAFACGARVAHAEWGCRTIGGEHLFLLTPPVYYIVKRIAMDWIADLRKQWKKSGWR